MENPRPEEKNIINNERKFRLEILRKETTDTKI